MPLHPTGVSRIPLRKIQGGRSALGPPDVYPQDPNQKEDELNAVHVKQVCQICNKTLEIFGPERYIFLLLADAEAYLARVIWVLNPLNFGKICY